MKHVHVHIYMFIDAAPAVFLKMTCQDLPYLEEISTFLLMFFKNLKNLKTLNEIFIVDPFTAYEGATAFQFGNSWL